MAVYSSKFATKNVQPRVGYGHRHLKSLTLAVAAVATVALGTYGLWQATMG